MKVPGQVAGNVPGNVAGELRDRHHASVGGAQEAPDQVRGLLRPLLGQPCWAGSGRVSDGFASSSPPMATGRRLEM